MSKRAFTPDEESEILAMRARGFPTKDIVEEYGHKNSVYSLFRRAGVAIDPSGPTDRRLSTAEHQQILTMWDEGRSLWAIHEATGRSEDLVKRVLRDADRTWEPRRSSHAAA